MQSRYLDQAFIYQLNTRVFCKENNMNLETISDRFFHSYEFKAADFIWFMGVWKPSGASKKIAREHAGLQSEYRKALSDLTDDDIAGSPYSISEYQPNPILCKGMSKIRELKLKLEKQGKKLILDFVPNHMSVDSPMIDQYPDLFLFKEGAETDQNSFLHRNGRVYFHGRDPYFDGWTDTVQWDFSRPGVLTLHRQFLLEIADVCHGVRCDMAMLPMKDVFEKTHGKTAIDYWKPLIDSIRQVYPNFIFMGEVYWNREYDLQQEGFDFTYDKTLYDRLKSGTGYEIRSHLQAEESFQKKSLRFMENHDEERAYHAFGERSIHCFSLLNFIPGAILYHEGQSLGLEIKLPVQLSRASRENSKPEVQEFYKRCFTQLIHRKHSELYREDLTFHPFDSAENLFISFSLSYTTEKVLHQYKTKEYNLEILTFNPESREIAGWLHPGKQSLDILHGIHSDKVIMTDVLTGLTYEKDKKEIFEKGIYVNLKPSYAHWFVVHISG